MRHLNRSVVLFAFLVLAACGSDEPGPAPSGSDTQSTRSGSAPTTAAEVARQARGKVKCPAKIDTAPPPADAPAVDVVGVRPGLTYEEAANVIMCTNDLLVIEPLPPNSGFRIQTYGQKVRQGFTAKLAERPKSSQEILDEMRGRTLDRSMNRATNRDEMRGTVLWSVSTIGMPGEERVIAAAREEWYEAGKQPTMDAVAKALVEKYGAPTQDQSRPGSNREGGYRYFTWAYDPSGQLITEGSSLFGQCTADASPGGKIYVSTRCGPVVAAELTALRENPALVEVIRVGMVDQADGYAALQATEEGLEAMEQQRRAREAEEAAENADQPVL